MENMENIKKLINKCWEEPTLENLKEAIKRLEEKGYKYRIMYDTDIEEYCVLYVGNGKGHCFALPGFFEMAGEVFPISSELEVYSEESKEKAKEMAKWEFLREMYEKGEGKKTLIEEYEEEEENQLGEKVTVYEEKVYRWEFEGEVYKVSEIYRVVCFSSWDLGFGTCQCFSHPYAEFEILIERMN